MARYKANIKKCDLKHLTVSQREDREWGKGWSLAKGIKFVS